MAKCILMCAGSYEPLEIEKQDGDYLIAVDGGFRYCLEQSLQPDLVLGDFDSVEPEYLEIIQQVPQEQSITLPVQKDDTDTLAAVKVGLDKGYRSFHIYGALGGSRMEHTLANLQTLLYLKNRGAKGYLLDKDCMVFLIQNETVTLGEKGPAYLSLFAMGGDAKGVTIKNMKYDIEDVVISSDYPVGISNEIIGTEPTISVEDGTLLAILRWM